VSFPDLCIAGIKAKFDSGAPTNSLFVSKYEIIKKGRKQYVLFIVEHEGKKMVCMEPRFCKAGFSCSETASQETIEIVTPIVFGTKRWNIRIGLSVKALSPLLIGRSGMRNRFYIDVAKEDYSTNTPPISPKNCKCSSKE